MAVSMVVFTGSSARDPLGAPRSACFTVYGWVDMWDNQDILYGCKNRIMVATCLCGAGGILHLCVRA